MLKNLTRSRVIQIWFVAIALIAAAAVVLGADMTLGTWGLLLGLSLVPPTIVMFLWPGVQPLTAGEVIRGSDRRP